MFNGIFHVPQPTNEPSLSYAPGTSERVRLKAKLQEMLGQKFDVPMIIGGQEVRDGALADMVCPHDHGHVLGHFHQGNALFVEKAIRAADEAKAEWSRMPWDSRAIVFLKAADLLAGKYRDTLNAATMLNMSKTPHQAEIDSACELIDFWRFNPHFMQIVYGDQPLSTPGVLNYMEHRPLDGFVLAITPFNFTSIAGNLPTAPALMGNTVVWKPASAAVLPAYFIMQVLAEAGLPPGVINMVPGRRPGRRTGRPGKHEPGRNSLHGQHEGVFDHLGWKSAPTSASTSLIRELWARPAVRTSSSPMRAPTSTPWSRRWCAGRSSIRARNARPPAGPTCPTPCGPWSKRSSWRR